jgi:hypothetical protein
VLETVKHSSWSRISREDVLNDIAWRIRQVRTVVTDPFELQAQKWLVEGQLSAEFTLKRHECADSMSIVFGIPPARSRVLHDATVLEISRELLPITKIPTITRGNLRGTRGFALARYANELSPEDFSKLVFLTRNLSPVAVIPAGRVDWTLGGFPEARPLF